MLVFALLLAQTGIAESLRAHKVVVAQAEYKGRMAVRVTPSDASGAEDQIAILKAGPAFRNGTIELDLAGRPGSGAGEGARGFTGVAFRIADDVKKFECIYLRPTNGRAEDQERRNHATQYISFPDFPWQKLRKDTPSKYESYVDLVPGEWTRVKIVVDGARAKLYVHGAEHPTLIVNGLKHGADAEGSIGFWVGPGTEAHFSSLKVTPKQ